MMTTTPKPPDDPIFGEYISCYSRASAIADGELVDVSQLAHEAGVKYPTAITRAVFMTLEPTENEKVKLGQSFNGRAWDLLNAMRITALSSVKTSVIAFKIIIQESIAGKIINNTYSFIARCTPGDTPEPVITISLPEESD